MKPNLPSVTLLMLDCVNYERSRRIFDHCLNCCNFGDAKFLTSFPCINQYDTAIDPIASIENYSKFLLTNIADYFSTSHCLITQYDGFIINPASWSDEFLNYDYVGAPWPTRFLYKNVNKQYRVGNGGFSLRSHRLQAVLKRSTINHYHPEDVMLCQYFRPQLEKIGIKFAPVELASKFSVEWGVIKDQFGQHGSAMGPNGELLQGVVKRIDIQE